MHALFTLIYAINSLSPSHYSNINNYASAFVSDRMHVILCLELYGFANKLQYLINVFKYVWTGGGGNMDSKSLRAQGKPLLHKVQV